MKIKKRILALFTFLVFMLTYVSYAADGGEAEIDFTAGMDGFQNAVFAKIVDVGGEHGNVLQIKADSAKKENLLFSGKNFNTEFSKALFRFDVNITDANSQMSILWHSTDNKVVSRMFFETNSTLKITNDSVNSDNIPFNIGEWYTFDILMDFATKETVWFMDGEKIFSCAMKTDVPDGAALKWFYVGVKQDNSTGEMLIDNVSVTNYGIDDFFGIDENSISIVNDKIIMKFKERVDGKTVPDSSGIVLKNTVSGETVDVDYISVDGYKLEIDLCDKPDENVEYAICGLEEIKSITGKGLDGDIIYFINLSGETGVPKIKTELDTLDFSEEFSKNNKITVNYGNDPICETDQANGVLKYQASGRDDGVRTNVTFNISDDTQDKKSVIVSYDVKLLKANVLSFQTRIYDTDGNQIYNAIFNAKNKFMSFKRANISPDYAVSNISEATSHAVTAELEPNVWHTITLKLDRDNIDESNHGTTFVYLDGQEVGSFATTTTAFNGVIGRLRFEDFNMQNSTYQGNPVKWGSDKDAVMLLDNLSIGYPENGDNVVKVRLKDRDGRVYGPLTDNISALAVGADIYFNSEIDLSSVSSDTIRIISQSGESIPYTVSEWNADNKMLSIKFDKILERSARYNIFVSDVKASDGMAVNEYQTSFDTSDKEELLIDNLRVTDADGNVVTDISDLSNGAELYINTDIYNSTAADKTINLIFGAVEGDTLNSVDLLHTTVSAREQLIVDKNSNSVKINVSDISNLRLCGYVCDSRLNVLEEIQIGTKAEYTENEYSVTVPIDISERTLFVVTDKTITKDNLENIAKENVYWIEIADAESGQNISFKMPLSAVSDKYNVIYASKTMTGQFEQPIEYVNKANATKVIADIKRYAVNNDNTSLKNTIINNKSDLMIDNDYIEKIDLDEAAAVIKDFVNTNNEFGADAKVDAANISRIITACGVKEGYITNLFDEADILKLDEGRLSKLYNEPFVTEDFGKNVTKAVENKKFKSIAEFEALVYEAFAVQTFKTSDGIDNCIAVVNEFYREIGFSNNNVSQNSVRKAMNNNSLATYQDIYNAMTKSDNTGGRDSGGSSGKSNGSGGLSYNIGGDVQELNQSKEPIADNIYSDLWEAEWATAAVVKLTERGIVHGKGNNEFKPNDLITREEFVQLAVNAFASNSEEGVITFSDVIPGEWYAPAVKKAYNSGIVKGISESLFGIGTNITRQDMAVMIKRCADIYGVALEKESSDNSFSDIDEVADYAESSMLSLAANGIINGIDGRLAPKENATRAQAAVIIYRIIMSK